MRFDKPLPFYECMPCTWTAAGGGTKCLVLVVTVVISTFGICKIEQNSIFPVFQNYVERFAVLQLKVPATKCQINHCNLIAHWITTWAFAVLDISPSGRMFCINFYALFACIVHHCDWCEWPWQAQGWEIVNTVQVTLSSSTHNSSERS